jgi:hypothetical protein
MTDSATWGGVACLMYLVCMFGPYCKTGTMPRWAPSISLGKNVYLKDGSLFLFGYHLHHWIFYFVLLVPCIIVRNHFLCAWCTVMIFHGLTYSDRFEI